MDFAPGQTLAEHLLELAETAGTLSSSGGLPEDEYELSRLKRAYGRGLQLLHSRKPTGWYRLLRTIPVRIGPTLGVVDDEGETDSSLYTLPPGAGASPMGGWTWSDGGTRRGVLVTTDWGRVTRALGDGDTGPPRMVAIAPVEPGTPDVDGALFRVRVAPMPDAVYTLEGLFRLSPGRPTELTQRHPFGADLDEAVLAAARFALIQNDREDPRRADFEAAFEKQAAYAVVTDNQAAPANLGEVTDPGVGRGAVGEFDLGRSGDTRITYNGVMITQ